MDAEMQELAEAVVARLGAQGRTLASVESCTGGLIGAAITAIAGSSTVYERGFITYSNAAKADLVGVDAAAIERFGAVSDEVARQMAEGGRARAGVDVALSVTGIAGPGGGSADKPVGLVFLACASSGETVVRREAFGDLGRAEIRRRSVLVALRLALGNIDTGAQAFGGP